jgi:hypothetical protein
MGQKQTMSKTFTNNFFKAFGKSLGKSLGQCLGNVPYILICLLMPPSSTADTGHTSHEYSSFYNANHTTIKLNEQTTLSMEELSDSRLKMYLLG